jgi:PAS domain S-box-containing protein
MVPDQSHKTIHTPIMDSHLIGSRWDESASAAETPSQHSGRVFETLFERSADAIWLFELRDPLNLVLVDCNQAAVELIGADNKQRLLHLRPDDLSPPFQPDGSPSARKAAEIIAIIQRQKSHRFEWAMRRLDGRDVPIEVSATAVLMNGRNIHVIFSRDISERKIAEHERVLRESEAKFRALFEGSSHGVVLHDELRLLEANSAAVRIFGCDNAQELLGKHPGELAPPLQPNGQKSAALARQYIEECITRGSVRFDWLARAPSGKDIPLEVALTRIEWSGRQVIQALITDITERVRAQTALAESEARFSAAFQASPALIGIIRMSDEQYVLANEAYLSWLDFPQEYVLARTCIELGIWEDLAERDAVLNDMRAHGSIRQKECRWRNRRGERFTILLSAEAITLNNTPHMLSMAMDITQRKRAEEELLRTLEREKELSQLKSNFVSMVSHEFRTPLGIIQSSSELLRDFSAKMQIEERQEQLNSIIRNTRRMAGMMEEVLVLSRLDAGKLEFQPAPMDMRAFCRRVVDEVLSATNRRCVIDLVLDGVPPEAKADEQLLVHIFTNLLSNAVKYSEPGETVWFTVARNGRDAVCTVRDPGIGISEDDKAQLFKAFHRGRNVGTRPGTGLGLLLVKRCTDLHAGRVELQSRIGGGTTVTVKLPVFETNP